MKLSFSSTANFNDPKSIMKFPWKLFTLIGVGIPMIFVIIGAGMLYWDNYRSQNWIDAPGQITFSEVASYQSDGSMMYTPDIRYSYELDAQEFSDDVNLSSSSVQSWALETTEEYPVGKEVTVKVDPEDFMNSYLPVSDTFLPIYFLIFGGIMAFIFAVAGIYGMRKKAQYSQQNASGEIPGAVS